MPEVCLLTSIIYLYVIDQSLDMHKVTPAEFLSLQSDYKSSTGNTGGHSSHQSTALAPGENAGTLYLLVLLVGPPHYTVSDWIAVLNSVPNTLQCSKV